MSLSTCKASRRQPPRRAGVASRGRCQSTATLGQQTADNGSPESRPLMWLRLCSSSLCLCQMLLSCPCLPKCHQTVSPCDLWVPCGQVCPVTRIRPLRINAHALLWQCPRAPHPEGAACLSQLLLGAPVLLQVSSGPRSSRLCGFVGEVAV